MWGRGQRVSDDEICHQQPTSQRSVARLALHCPFGSIDRSIVRGGLARAGAASIDRSRDASARVSSHTWRFVRFDTFGRGFRALLLGRCKSSASCSCGGGSLGYTARAWTLSPSLSRPHFPPRSDALMIDPPSYLFPWIDRLAGPTDHRRQNMTSSSSKPPTTQRDGFHLVSHSVLGTGYWVRPPMPCVNGPIHRPV